jgi:hypothetical protein
MEGFYRNLPFASLAVSTTITFAFLAQFLLVEARPPQFLTIPLPSPLPVTALVDMDASRSNLNTLRGRRNGVKKSHRKSDGECIHAH